LAQPGFSFLKIKANELFVKFALEPRDFLCRGQTEKVVKRLQRIRSSFFDALAFAPLPEKEFQVQIAKWRNQVNELAQAERHKESAQGQLVAFLNEDFFFLNLLRDEEDQVGPKFAMKTLTRIMGTAVGESLGREVLFLKALCAQDKAQRRQTLARNNRGNGAADEVLQKQTNKDVLSGWTNTRNSWKDFLERYDVTAAVLRTRLGAIKQRWSLGRPDEAVRLWQQLFKDWHTAHHARLLLVQAQEKTRQAKGTRPILEKLAEDLKTDSEQSGLKDELAAHLNQLRKIQDALAAQAGVKDNPQAYQVKVQLLIVGNWVQQLQNLQEDLGPLGTLQALKETVANRLRQ
jgi:hypothetical protein